MRSLLSIVVLFATLLPRLFESQDLANKESALMPVLKNNLFLVLWNEPWHCTRVIQALTSRTVSENHYVRFLGISER